MRDVVACVDQASEGRWPIDLHLSNRSAKITKKGIRWDEQEEWRRTKIVYCGWVKTGGGSDEWRSERDLQLEFGMQIDCRDFCFICRRISLQPNKCGSEKDFDGWWWIGSNVLFRPAEFKRMERRNDQNGQSKWWPNTVAATSSSSASSSSSQSTSSSSSVLSAISHAWATKRRNGETGKKEKDEKMKSWKNENEQQSKLRKMKRKTAIQKLWRSRATVSRRVERTSERANSSGPERFLDRRVRIRLERPKSACTTARFEKKTNAIECLRRFRRIRSIWRQGAKRTGQKHRKTKDKAWVACWTKSENRRIGQNVRPADWSTAAAASVFVVVVVGRWLRRAKRWKKKDQN